MNKLNSGYMNDIFKLGNADRLTRAKCKLNLEILKANQTFFRAGRLGATVLKYGILYPAI